MDIFFAKGKIMDNQSIDTKGVNGNVKIKVVQDKLIIVDVLLL